MDSSGLKADIQLSMGVPSTLDETGQKLKTSKRFDTWSYWGPPYFSLRLSKLSTVGNALYATPWLASDVRGLVLLRILVCITMLIDIYIRLAENNGMGLYWYCSPSWNEHCVVDDEVGSSMCSQVSAILTIFTTYSLSHIKAITFPVYSSFSP